ncbi:MAG TPA: hypothetical protein VFA83_06230 [Acidimicrobiales bacterium]|nr:hypothetical protein [Acidimicrobiales bacterium]
MRVPIACTLTAEQQPDRLGEWRAFLTTHVEAAELSPTQARLKLRAGDDAFITAADLALREKQCCAFFEFNLRLDTDGRWMTIGVPDDAAPVLADLLTLLPADLRD